MPPTASAKSGLLGAASLAVTAVLCLPSLLGASALAVQAIRYRDIRQWQEIPAALIALGALLGGPLVAAAAMVGAVISLTRLSTRVKLAHLSIIGAASIATFSLLIRFA